MDWLCTIAVFISAAELLVLIAYYVPLVRVVPFSVILHGKRVVDLSRFSDSFVSDLLHSDSAYNMLLTSLVAMHLGVCILFVARLNWPLLARKPLMVVEVTFLTLAWVGWVILDSYYLGADGRMVIGHMVGAGIFIVSSSVYFGCMAWNVAKFGEGPWTMMENVLFLLMVVFFLASTGAALVFVAGFFDHRIPLPWIFEHASFILFMGANMLLFLVNGMFVQRHREARHDIFSDVRIRF